MSSLPGSTTRLTDIRSCRILPPVTVPPKRLFPLFLLDLAADLAAIVAAYFAAFVLRFHTPLGRLMQTTAARLDLLAEPIGFSEYQAFYLDPLHAFRIILLLALVLLPLNAFFGLYSGRRFLKTEFTAFRLLQSALLALFLFIAYLYISRNRFHPRSTFLLLMALQFLFSVPLRKGAEALMAWLRARTGLDHHPVLLAGEPEAIDPMERFLRERQPHGLMPVRRLDLEPGMPPEAVADSLLAAARACGADTIGVADRRLSIAALMTLLDRADAANLTVKLASPRLDVLIHAGRIEADRFQDRPWIHFSPTADFEAGQRLRRIGSCLLAAVLLAAAAPLFLVIAAAIRLTSRGPVLFIQTRVGRHGQVFRMFKFRTMRAEASPSDPPAGAVPGAGPFKLRRDPRVTPLGRLLRSSSLDELPQLVNVLRGEMNLVGPRPLPVEDDRLYTASWHRDRHKGVPGMTGLWQVSGRSDLTFEQMCLLDLYYLHNASLSLDARILFRTVVTLLFAKGAY